MTDTHDPRERVAAAKRWVLDNLGAAAPIVGVGIGGDAEHPVVRIRFETEPNPRVAIPPQKFGVRLEWKVTGKAHLAATRAASTGWHCGVES